MSYPTASLCGACNEIFISHVGSSRCRQVILVLRIYAMYGRTRVMLGIICVLAVCEAVSAAAILGLPRPGTIGATPSCAANMALRHIHRHQQPRAWCVHLSRRRSAERTSNRLRLGPCRARREHIVVPRRVQREAEFEDHTLLVWQCQLQS